MRKTWIARAFVGLLIGLAACGVAACSTEDEAEGAVGAPADVEAERQEAEQAARDSAEDAREEAEAATRAAEAAGAVEPEPTSDVEEPLGGDEGAGAFDMEE